MNARQIVAVAIVKSPNQWDEPDAVIEALCPEGEMVVLDRRSDPPTLWNVAPLVDGRGYVIPGQFRLTGVVAVSPEPPKDQPCPVGGHHMAKATEDACPACGVSPEPPKEQQP